MKLNSTTSQDYSNMFEVENTTHAVPRFRGAHVSQSGAPKGVPYRFHFEYISKVAFYFYSLFLSRGILLDV